MAFAGVWVNSRKLLNDLTVLSYEVLHENGNPATAKRMKEPYFFKQRRQLLLKAEHFLLSALNFDLVIQTAYKPLACALKEFNVFQWHSKFAQVSWNFVNDGLMTTVCLQFKPLQVAGAAFYLSLQQFVLELTLQKSREIHPSTSKSLFIQRKDNLFI